jgi:hypothetical protein
VNADDLVSLWQIVSKNVFAAVEKERREAEEAQRIEASKPKNTRAVRSPSRSVTLPKTVRPKAVKPQSVKPQAVAPQSVSKQKSPQLISQARRQMMQPQAKTQLPIMPRTATVQPTHRTPQLAQPINQQQVAQANRKLYYPFKPESNLV